MKVLSAAFTAVILLGFAGAAAAACAGYAEPAAEQSAQTPLIVPPATTGS